MSVQRVDTVKPKALSSAVHGDFCEYRGERFYKIDQYHQMANFFMSVVSSSDHWLFISSNGGLTAGRQNAQRSLFPYYTEDKLSDMAHCTGPITLIREGNSVWQPFATASLLNKPESRALYKSVIGDQLFFSETRDGLRFDYGWAFSDKYGIVRTATLTNDSQQSRSLKLLDGLQNIIPANVTSDLQTNNSVLLDAYKSTDLYDQNIAAFSLSSRLTDLAEPSESLTANTTWYSVKNKAFLPTVSIDQKAAEQFLDDGSIPTTERVRGQRGSYFIQADITLAPGESAEWYLVSEVTQDATAISVLRNLVKSDKLGSLINDDIKAGSQALTSHLAKVDGLQCTAEELTTVHHQANALFNMMRGGFFEDGYHIDREDLKKFVAVRQTRLADHAWWQKVGKSLTIVELEPLLAECDSVDLKRLVREYLPISFSRRHGDPSRPWNQFSINLKDSDGQSIKDYQGNWRDIFQNWEPLAYSYPKFLPAMISAFLNATSADGYNPYRVTRQGIEWEEPEPDNAWANIGYWSDHQIIYLSKLLELQAQIDPSWFKDAMSEARFSYANVPYRIKGFSELSKDPYDSIDFDHDLNTKIDAQVETMGTDAKLLLDASGNVVHANLIEKLLTLWLAKLSNFVPGGGLWMNTQRPEWNDANNALAGWGLSVVTVAYLHRHLKFMRTVLGFVGDVIEVDASVAAWFKDTAALVKKDISQSSEESYQLLKSLITSADVYRKSLYEQGLSGSRENLTALEFSEFIEAAIKQTSATLKANKRDDALYHGYNILHLHQDRVEVENLPVMLEGQVAVLSANLLNADETVECLDALRKSDLYREDQHTYLLYPNKQLPSFVDKNQVKAEWLEAIKDSKSQLLAKRVLKQSGDGNFHFDVKLRNAKELSASMRKLGFAEDVIAATETVWETTFQHKSFTGRSGSFFAYEGLGSTYWHMVSKLLLAVQENWQRAKAAGSEHAETLAEMYYDVRAGIGFNKTPAQYGAFPTDPYSHTPETGIARQPGMTGQVKEELITRLGELGVQWQDGVIRIKPALLKTSEYLQVPATYEYLDVEQQWQTLELPIGSLAFTLAQVPFVYQRDAEATEQEIRITDQNGQVESVKAESLPASVVEALSNRSGQVQKVEVIVPIDN